MPSSNSRPLSHEKIRWALVPEGHPVCDKRPKQATAGHAVPASPTALRVRLCPSRRMRPHDHRMKYFAVTAFFGLLAYLAWPFYHVWQLNQAVVAGDRASLSRLVDLPRVKIEINKKLNKEVDSVVGEVSSSFVRWLQEGIHRLGNDAVERLVTLDWVEAGLRRASGCKRMWASSSV